MKNRIRTFIVIVFFILLLTFCFAIQPQVDSVTASQRTDGSKIVDISFNVTCSNQDSVYIILKLSDDSGVTYKKKPTRANLSGDIGWVDLSTGNSRQIIWNVGNELESFNNDQYKFKVQAWDKQPIPSNFILIQSGTYNNGVANIAISSFYIDKYEVLQEGDGSYLQVMGTRPSDQYHGAGAGYPVNNVTWFNAIEYCNRRSMQEGLTPCYSDSTSSYGNYGTNPDNWPVGWNTEGNQGNVLCNWTANGYRLPTEMEWIFAARGGNSTHNYTYSGSNDINSVAWYGGNSHDSLHVVGTRTANELGINDMSGNVYEWCWDKCNQNSNVFSEFPYGPTSGNYRISHGSAWRYTSELWCTLRYRTTDLPTYTNNCFGFRVCRK